MTMKLSLEENLNLETTELELKYSAEKIKRSEFIELARSLNPIKELEAFSWDIYYYGNKHNLPYEYMRYRNSQTPELTVKMRVNEKNNHERVEIDLPLSPETKPHIVEAFCAKSGFDKNFKIYKDCMIFWYEKVDIVYYLVLNENRDVLGKYAEIECRKDVKFASKKEAWDEVRKMEILLGQVGITHHGRMDKSLWDIYGKQLGGKE